MGLGLNSVGPETIRADDPLSGLVWAYAFDEEGRGGPFPPGMNATLDDVRRGFVWLHLNLVDVRVCGWCENQTVLPDKARLAFLSADRHLRLDHSHSRVWGLFADLAQDFTRPSDEPAQLRFIMGERWLVTGRRHPLRGAQLARAKIDEGARFSSPCAVLEAIAESALDHVHGLIETLEQELDTVEDRVVVRARDDEDRRLAPIRHRLVSHNRQLSKFSAVLHRFVSWADKADLPPDTHTVAARLLQRTEALRHDVDAMQARARLLQEEAVDNRGAEMNRHLYVLSILTAALMPPTLVVGVFGMNTGGLPFAGSPYGSFIALLIGFATSGFVFWLFHRMRRQNRR